MRPTPMTAILALSLAAAAPAMAASLKDIAPYPEAEKGFTRQVIHLRPRPTSRPINWKSWLARRCRSTAIVSAWAATWKHAPWKAGATITTAWTTSAARPAR